MAKLKAMYKLKNATIGSVKSIWRGRSKVTVTRNFIFAERLGKGEGGGGRPSFLARRARIVFL
jgi:hypothetical protein